MTIENLTDDTNTLPPEVVVGANLLAEGLEDLEGNTGLAEAVEHTNQVLDGHHLGYEIVKKPDEVDHAELLFDRLTREGVLSPSTPDDIRRRVFERMLKADSVLSDALRDTRTLEEKPTDHFVTILRGLARSKRLSR